MKKSKLKINVNFFILNDLLAINGGNYIEKK